MTNFAQLRRPFAQLRDGVGPGVAVRDERLIALARVVLAVFLVVPTLSRPRSSVAAACYAAWAVLVCVTVCSPAPSRRLRWPAHAFDMLVFPVLLGIGNFGRLFTLPVFFSQASAAARWGWAGIVWGTVGGVAVIAGMELYDAARRGAAGAGPLTDDALATVAVGALLGLVGWHERRRWREASDLARLARTGHAGVSGVLPLAFRRAARTLGARRVVAVWREPERCGVALVSWSAGEFRAWWEPEGRFEPPVVDSLAGQDFLCADSGAAGVLCRSARGSTRHHGSPVHPDLRAGFDMRAVLSCEMSADGAHGRLFFLDMRDMTRDDLVLGGRVARVIAEVIAGARRRRRETEATRADERLRLSRDLHDGVLQALAGAALRLAAVRALPANGSDAGEALGEVECLLEAEQRGVRRLVERLRARPSPGPDDGGLAGGLEALADEITRTWGMKLELIRLDGLPALPGPLVREAYFLVREAVTNAARHSGGSVVTVELAADPARVCIAVSDDGRGFPFHGRFELAALRRAGIGPTTLVQRVDALGGSLTLDSRPSGTRLLIAFPAVEALG